MSTHYDNTARIFHSLIEQMSVSVDAIADIMGAAADGVVDGIFREQKVFCCGIGLDACTAMLLSELLRSGALRERPALPVVELTLLSAQPLTGAVQRLCDQLGALGQPGDWAVLFGTCLDDKRIAAIEAVLNKRQIAAVWIGAQGTGPSLTFPGTTATSALSLCQASAVCLAELIDITMFGPLEDIS